MYWDIISIFRIIKYLKNKKKKKMGIRRSNDNKEKIFKILLLELENDKYDWRTLEGLTRSTNKKILAHKASYTRKYLEPKKLYKKK